jgi:hypothetical protein
MRHRRIQLVQALLLFHLRVGVRVAIRASPPLFCGIVAIILFQDQTTDFVQSLAGGLYARHWSMNNVLPFVAIAFLLPLWARQRLAQGLDGWLRHLPFSDVSNRRGLLLALISVQLPLIFLLAMLSLTAARMGFPVPVSAARWVLVLMAGSMTSMPARNRFRVLVPLSVTSAFLALHDAGQYGVLSLVLLVVADGLAGPIDIRKKSIRWRDSGVFIGWRIGWRALNSRILVAFVLGLVAIGAGRLFIVNNQLEGPPAAAAARLSGTLACALCLCSLSKRLATDRPAWPLARSFPWSASRRVIEDSIFLSLHTLPFVVLVALSNRSSMLVVLSVLPLMTVRGAEFIRRIPQRRAAAIAYLGEGAFIAVVVTMLPWAALLCVPGTFLALLSAKRIEQRQRVTSWFELHHASTGDSFSWR